VSPARPHTQKKHMRVLISCVGSVAFKKSRHKTKRSENCSHAQTWHRVTRQKKKYQQVGALVVKAGAVYCRQYKTRGEKKSKRFFVDLKRCKWQQAPEWRHALFTMLMVLQQPDESHLVKATFSRYRRLNCRTKRLAILTHYG
jgi:hypothetical protein